MNGEKYLPITLKRIEEVIPSENVNRKILVDDHSIDNTVKIAKDFNWEVYTNPRSGIPSGANEALKHVKSEQFISIEQDVILAKNWWEKIPNYIENKEVVVAQGIRMSTNKILRKMDEYIYSRLRKDPLRFGLSMDNNIIRTKVIREIGGFPDLCPTCMDVILMKILVSRGYKWVIDEKVISDHLRTSILGYAKHSYKLSQRCAGTKYCSDVDIPLMGGFRLFLTSPFRGTIMAIKKRCWQLAFVYPLIRYYKLKGQLARRIRSYGTC
jgi:glycosyltransferase involved in cell wall biosynthesis